MCVALGSCSHPVSPDPDPLESATITLMQYTHDQVNRMLVVKIAAGDRQVRVQSVEVVSGAFSGTGLEEYDATVAAGRTLDLRVPLGLPRCDSVLSPEQVSVEFRVADRVVVIDEPAGSDTLAAIHHRECAAERADDEVPLRWGPQWRTTGTDRQRVVLAPLRIGPVAADTSIQLTALEESVIFAIEADGLPVTLAPGESRLLEVRFRPARCDPHVWETSRGFQFAARLRFGSDVDDVLVPLVPSPPEQQLLTRFWQERCAKRPGAKPRSALGQVAQSSGS